MIYHGTTKTETIIVHPFEDEIDVEFIAMITDADSMTLYVNVNEYSWEFVMRSLSDYEWIKFTIMEVIQTVNNMEELVSELNEVFVENFEDILIEYSDDDDDESGIED